MEDLIANLKNHPFLAVLALVTVLFAGFRILNPGASPSVARGEPGSPAVDSESDHGADGHWHRLQPVYTWEDRVHRDPFAVIETVVPVVPTEPPAGQTEPKMSSGSEIDVPEIPDFKLTTIMQGKHTIAVINGRSVIAGMSIEHWAVLDIDEDQVKLERDGLCILLTVSGERHAEVPIE
tara:strand:+ start:54969 stop:55505 length:537 start_codon:yes stop_codon:yes gene_type:complete